MADRVDRWLKGEQIPGLPVRHRPVAEMEEEIQRLAEENRRLLTERDRLLEHSNAVLALHQSVEINYRDVRCVHCVAWDEDGKEFGQYNVPWPCPTARTFGITRGKEASTDGS